MSQSPSTVPQKTKGPLPVTVPTIVVGFVTAFLTALAVVRFLLDFVSRHGFGPFAWWRIAVGLAGLAGLAVTGAL